MNPYKVKAGVEEERENCALGGRRTQYRLNVMERFVDPWAGMGL